MGDARYGSFFSAEDTPLPVATLAGNIQDGVTWCNEEYWQQKAGVGGTTAYFQIAALCGELGYSPGAGTGPSGTYDSVRNRLDAFGLGENFLPRDGSLPMLGDLDMDNYNIVDCGSIVIDRTDPEAFLVRKGGDVGDVFTVDTTNSIMTVLASSVLEDVIIDDSSTEAFLIRKSGDAGDVFSVDTVNSIAALTGSMTTTGDIFNGGKLTVDVDNANALLVRKEDDTSIFNVATDVAVITIAASIGMTGDLVADGQHIIDHTNPEALLVRKNGDTGDVFTVDTTTPDVTINSAGYVTGLLSVTGDLSVNTNKFTVTAASGNTLVAGTLDSTGSFAVNTNKFQVSASTGITVVAGQIQSQVTTGTSPLSILSTTVCANLNADLLDGQHASDFSTVTDHGALTGLVPDDDHTQYALLAGRSGGQTLYGGTAAGNDISIDGSSHATKGDVLLAGEGGFVGVGGAVSAYLLQVNGSFQCSAAANVAGTLTVSTNKMSVDSATGNTLVAGTLGVTGQINGTVGVDIGTVLAVGSGASITTNIGIWLAHTFGSTGDAYALSLSPVFPDSSGTVYGIFLSDVTGGGVDSFSIYSNGGKSYFKDNVGIGTTTPVSLLNVEAPNSTVGTHYVTLTVDADNYPAHQMGVFTHDNAWHAFDAYLDSAGTWKSSDAGSSFIIYKNIDVFKIMYDVAAAGANVSWNDGISMDASGNVAIGSSTANQDLVIYRGTADAYMIFQNATTGDLADEGFMIGMDYSGVDAWIWHNENQPIFIGTNDTLRMTVLGSGLVGIGSHTPGALLDVNSAGSTQLRLSYTAGSVYTDFKTQSDGYLNIVPTGNRIGVNATGGNPGYDLDWTKTSATVLDIVYRNTADGVDAFPRIRFHNIGQTGEPFFCGSIIFEGNDSASATNLHNYCRLVGLARDYTSTTEDGEFVMYLMNAGTEHAVMIMLADGTLRVDATGTSGSYANVELFDDYNDPVEVEKIIKNDSPSRGIRDAVMAYNDSGEPMWNLQPMIRLVGSASYQNHHRIESHKTRIEKLERENSELRKEVELLKAA